ncbi:MAG: hypothetical protein Q9187_005425 [Circinaria calcarea]
MKGIAVAAVAAGLLVTASEAIQLVKRDIPSVVAIGIQRKSVDNPVARDRIRRRAGKTVSQTLDNYQSGSLYFANVTLGTPPQNLRFHIDTGSSDLWTNSVNSELCQLSPEEAEAQDFESCSVSGTYNANASSTYQYLDSNFLIRYADRSGAQGDYVTDTLRIGGSTLTKLQLAVGYNSTSSEGVMGIGYPALEVQAVNNGDQPYANIPQAMVEQGLIQSNAYSLWLDDLASSSGSILFGGVDTDKYHGSLSTLPIQPEEGAYLEMIVTLTGVSLTQNGKNTSMATTELPTGVLLDSGSTLSYMPATLAQNLYKALNVQYSSRARRAFCDCSLAQSTATIDFSFSGAVISVPLREMVLQGGADAQTLSGSLGCTFGIAAIPASSSGGGTFTLGDTFLRSAYVVYDIANNEISLAPTNFNSVKTNVMEIGTGANSVPDASGIASAVSVAVTGTATKVNGGLTATGTVTLGSGAAATAAASRSRGPSSIGRISLAAAAGALGGGLLGLLAL